MTRGFDWKAERQILREAIAHSDLNQARAQVRRLLNAEASPRVFAACRSAAMAMAELTQSAGSAQMVHLHILRSYTVEPGVAPLISWAFTRGLSLEVSLASYNQFEQVLLAPPAIAHATEEPASASAPDAVLFLARLDELSPALHHAFASLSKSDALAEIDAVLERISTWMDLARRKWPRAKLLVGGLVAPIHGAYGLAECAVEFGQRRAIGELNRRLAQLCGKQADVIFIDLEPALQAVGLEHALDATMNAHARQPYSPVGLAAMGSWISRVLAATLTPRKKCIVLDCDNTLWGGVVGEDGLDGIALGPDYPGSAFVDFQHALVDLHHRGVILALASKNNEADVLEVLDSHPHQVIGRKHIAATAISWEDKASGIESLAREINIGIDSMVFIDDSDYECALVRDRLPSVLTIQTPNSPLELRSMLEQLDCFDVVRVSATDRQRGSMYRAQAARTRAKADAPSLDQFLHSLELRLSLRLAATPAELDRVAQLCQRTNQLNVTTVRHQVADIESLVADADADVIIASLADRFGDYGICGVAIVRSDDQILDIDTLLLSCRVIGRGLEDALAFAIEHSARQRGIDVITSTYIATAKNSLVADLFDRLGYSRLAERSEVDPSTTHYRKQLLEPATLPPWFTLEPGSFVLNN